MTHPLNNCTDGSLFSNIVLRQTRHTLPVVYGTRLDSGLASYPIQEGYHALLIRSGAIPKDVVSADPTNLGNYSRLNRNSTPPHLGSPPPKPQATPFLEYLCRALPDWQQELLTGLLQTLE